MQFVTQILLEHRKLRGSVNLSFQDAKTIQESPISNIIIEQCPTKFLFPNISANEEDYSIFKLSPYEWSYIKGKTQHKKSHTVLMKRDDYSVILDLDMLSMGSLLNLYSSNIDDVKKVINLKSEYGGQQWLGKYLYG